MKKIKLMLYVLAVSIIAVSCNSASETPVKNEKVSFDGKSILDQASKFFAVLPTTAINPNNELTESKIALGKTIGFLKTILKAVIPVMILRLMVLIISLHLKAIMVDWEAEIHQQPLMRHYIYLSFGMVEMLMLKSKQVVQS